MPSKSKKQHDLMQAVAHSLKFAKQVGIPQSVGKKYVEEDTHESKSHERKEHKEKNHK